jgi:Malectin domain
MFSVAHHSDSVSAEGQRIFRVLFEGGAITSDPIDIFAGSGKVKFRAFVLKFAVTVSDGELNVGFSPIVGSATICGIEITGPPTVFRPIATPFYMSAGPSYTSTTTTKFWIDDAPYVTGGIVSTALGLEVDIANTDEDGLYRKERYGDATMAYNIPIVNGNYRVLLHFAELLYVQGAMGNVEVCRYFGLTACVFICSADRRGQRIFKVLFEGGAVTSDPIDIVKGSGSALRAFILPFDVTVSDGELNIGFGPTVQNAQICGVEIRAASPAGVISEFPFFISAGPSYTSTTTTKIWVADAPYARGGIVSSGTSLDKVDFRNTDQDGLYRKERYGDATMAYKIPIVNGSYRVILHFAEL